MNAPSPLSRIDYFVAQIASGLAAGTAGNAMDFANRVHQMAQEALRVADHMTATARSQMQQQAPAAYAQPFQQAPQAQYAPQQPFQQAPQAGQFAGQYVGPAPAQSGTFGGQFLGGSGTVHDTKLKPGETRATVISPAKNPDGSIRGGAPGSALPTNVAENLQHGDPRLAQIAGAHTPSPAAYFGQSFAQPQQPSQFAQPQQPSQFAQPQYAPAQPQFMQPPQFVQAAALPPAQVAVYTPPLQEPPGIECPSCGTRNHAQSTYCGHCASALRAAPQAPQAPQAPAPMPASPPNGAINGNQTTPAVLQPPAS